MLFSTACEQTMSSSRDEACSPRWLDPCISLLQTGRSDMLHHRRAFVFGDPLNYIPSPDGSNQVLSVIASSNLLDVFNHCLGSNMNDFSLAATQARCSFVMNINFIRRPAEINTPLLL